MIGHLLLRQLRELRRHNIHCDLELVAKDNASFHVHQIVFIALNRRHFQLAIKKAEHDDVGPLSKKMYLGSLSATELKLLVEFMYGSTVRTKSKYDCLVSALGKLDMLYLLEEAGGFTFENEDVQIKTEMGRQPENISLVHGNLSEKEQPLHQAICGDNVCGTHENNVLDESSSALPESVHVKQEPVSTYCETSTINKPEQNENHQCKSTYITQSQPYVDATDTAVTFTGNILTDTNKTVDSVAREHNTDNAEKDILQDIKDEISLDSECLDISVAESEINRTYEQLERFYQAEEIMKSSGGTTELNETSSEVQEHAGFARINISEPKQENTDENMIDSITVGNKHVHNVYKHIPITDMVEEATDASGSSNSSENKYETSPNQNLRSVLPKPGVIVYKDFPKMNSPNAGRKRVRVVKNSRRKDGARNIAPLPSDLTVCNSEEDSCADTTPIQQTLQDHTLVARNAGAKVSPFIPSVLIRLYKPDHGAMMQPKSISQKPDVQCISVILSNPSSSQVELCSTPKVELSEDCNVKAISPAISDLPITLSVPDLPITPAVSSFPKIAPTVTRLPITPAVSILPIAPAVSILPIAPAVSILPTTPAVSRLPTTPAVSGLPITPTVSKFPIAPIVSRLPIAPTVSRLPIAPTVSRLPIAPAVSRLPVTPALSRLPITPAVSNWPLTPTAYGLPPTVSGMPITPAGSGLPITPAVSLLPITPAISRLPITPAVSRLPITPAVSRLPIAPTVSCLPITPTVSRLPIALPVSRLPITPAVSRLPVAPALSSLPIAPTLSRLPITPAVSNWPLTPTASGLPLTLTASGLPSTPTVSGMPITTARSGLPITPAISILPITPAVSRLPITPAVSRLPITPAVSSLPIAPALSGLQVATAVSNWPLTPTASVLPLSLTASGLPLTLTASGLPITAAGSGMPLASTGLGWPITLVGSGWPITPAVARLPITPAVSRLPITPAVYILPRTPAVSTLPITPASSGLQVAMAASNWPLTPTASGLPLTLTASGLPLTLTASSLPLTPAGSGMPITPDGSDMPITLTGPGWPVTSVESGRPIIPAGCVMPITPAGYGLPITSTGPVWPVTSVGAGWPITSAGSGLALTPAGMPLTKSGLAITLTVSSFPIKQVVSDLPVSFSSTMISTSTSRSNVISTCTPVISSQNNSTCCESVQNAADKSVSSRNIKAKTPMKVKMYKRRPLFKKSMSKVKKKSQPKVDESYSKKHPFLVGILNNQSRSTQFSLGPTCILEKEDGTHANDLEETELLVDSATAYVRNPLHSTVMKENDGHAAIDTTTADSKKDLNNTRSIAADESLTENISETERIHNSHFNDESNESASIIIKPQSEILTLTPGDIDTARSKAKIKHCSRIESVGKVSCIPTSEILTLTPTDILKTSITSVRRSRQEKFEVKMTENNETPKQLKLKSSTKKKQIERAIIPVVPSVKSGTDLVLNSIFEAPKVKLLPATNPIKRQLTGKTHHHETENSNSNSKTNDEHITYAVLNSIFVSPKTSVLPATNPNENSNSKHANDVESIIKPVSDICNIPPSEILTVTPCKLTKAVEEMRSQDIIVDKDKCENKNITGTCNLIENFDEIEMVTGLSERQGSEQIQSIVDLNIRLNESKLIEQTNETGCETTVTETGLSSENKGDNGLEISSLKQIQSCKEHDSIEALSMEKEAMQDMYANETDKSVTDHLKTDRGATIDVKQRVSNSESRTRSTSVDVIAHISNSESRHINQSSVFKDSETDDVNGSVQAGPANVEPVVNMTSQNIGTNVVPRHLLYKMPCNTLPPVFPKCPVTMLRYPLSFHGPGPSGQIRLNYELNRSEITYIRIIPRCSASAIKGVTETHNVNNAVVNRQGHKRVSGSINFENDRNVKPRTRSASLENVPTQRKVKSKIEDISKRRKGKRDLVETSEDVQYRKRKKSLVIKEKAIIKKHKKARIIREKVLIFKEVDSDDDSDIPLSVLKSRMSASKGLATSSSVTDEMSGPSCSKLYPLDKLSTG